MAVVDIRWRASRSFAFARNSEIKDQHSSFLKPSPKTDRSQNPLFSERVRIDSEGRAANREASASSVFSGQHFPNDRRPFSP